MSSWRGAWAAAQVTGVLFSTLVWIAVWGLSLPSLMVILAVGAAAVGGRNTPPMLWWRFGAQPANDLEREAMLTATVPIASLRGRHQPSVWIGRRLLGGRVVMPSSALLVASPEFAGRVASGQLTDRQASAIISQALGMAEVADSTLANLVEAYCLPWRFVQVLVAVVSQFAARHRTVRFSWKIRWIVFGVAIVDSYLNARWPAFVGVVMISVLSGTTGYFQNRWDRKCQDRCDQHTVDEGLGSDLANLILRGDRSLASSERANRLRRGSPGETNGGGSRTPDGALPFGPPVDRLERRSCAGRRNS